MLLEHQHFYTRTSIDASLCVRVRVCMLKILVDLVAFAPK